MLLDCICAGAAVLYTILLVATSDLFSFCIGFMPRAREWRHVANAAIQGRLEPKWLLQNT